MSKPAKKYDRRAAWRERNPWARHVEYARRRCTDPDNKDFKFYGGKGIEVKMDAKDARAIWERDGAGAMKKPSLDRIDSSGHYTRDNCRFIEKSINERLPHDAALRAEVDDEGETLPGWVTEPDFTCSAEGAYAP